MSPQTNELIKASYAVAVEFAKSPKEVFAHLIDLDKWWLEDFVGERLRLDSEFILKTGDGHFSKNKVIDFEPGKKLAWIATESLRKTDNYDWSGSKFIFELSLHGNKTLVSFTYDGVVFKNEYDVLVKVCDLVVKEKLFDFIVNGTTK